MSAPNFCIKNASRYFVLGTPVYYTQEDIDECELDQDLLGKYDEVGTEISYQAAKDNVFYNLKAKGWDDIDECDNDSSYPTHLFAEKMVSIKCGDNSVEVTLQAGATSGYFQAANFDWFASVKFCGLIEGYYDEIEPEADELTADDVIRENWYGNEGFSKIHAGHIIKKIEAIIDELKNEAELAFSMYCDVEMYCEGVFSNGEAVYGAAGKPLWKEVEDQNKKTA